MVKEQKKPRVIRIGAGPAGLTAAYRLTAAGLPVTTLEREPELVGGISRTERYKGFRFDVEVAPSSAVREFCVNQSCIVMHSPANIGIGRPR